MVNSIVPVAAELLLIAQMLRACADAQDVTQIASIADNVAILSAATRLMEIELGLVRGVMTPEDARAETSALMRAAQPQNQQIAGAA